MKTIRNSVFETNSSSMHSLTIKKNIILEKIVPTYTTFKFEQMTDSREGDFMETPYDKAQYFWETVCSIYSVKNLDGKSLDKDSYIIKPNNDGKYTYDSIYNADGLPISLRELMFLVRDYLNGVQVSFDLSKTDDYYWSNIDHQSINQDKWIFYILSDKQLFLNYLFNDKFVVHLSHECGYVEPSENEIDLFNRFYNYDDKTIDLTYNPKYIEDYNKRVSNLVNKVKKYKHKIKRQIKKEKSHKLTTNKLDSIESLLKDIKTILEEKLDREDY